MSLLDRHQLSKLVGIVLFFNAHVASVCYSQTMLGGDGHVAKSPLSQISDVLTLSSEQIAKRPAFDMEAVVYHYDENYHFFFIGQGNEFISCSGEQDVVPPFGSRVRIKGTINYGLVKPTCSVETLELISDNSESLAIPQPVRLDDMSIGDKDCHLVSVSAVIRNVRIAMGNTVLGCRQGNTNFTIGIDERVSSNTATKYIGAEVEISGNLGIEVYSAGTDSEAINGFEVITNLEKVKIVGHATGLDYAPLHTVSVIWNDKTATAFHLNGQVTYVGATGFFLETRDSGTWIHNDTNMEISVGNYLEVLGSRKENGDLNALVCKNKGSRPLHQPSLDDIDKVVAEKREARRVKLRGEYLGMKSAVNAPSLLLDVDGCRVEVFLLPEQLANLNLESAKLITVTGTAAFYSQSDADVAIFTPSLDDIVITERKLQWSSSAVAAGVATTIGLLSLCLYWGSNLRQQVNQKRIALEKVSAELRLSYESIQEGIIILGLDQCVSYANRRASEVLGFDIPVGIRIDAMRDHLAMGGVDRNFLMEWDTLNASLSDVREVELELTSKDDQKKIIEAFSSPVQNAAGEFVNRLWKFHDVTEKQQLHASLTHAQKQEAVGRLASGFAHDFNNLLTGIICSLSVAKSDPTKTIEEASTCINTALSASERAASLVAQILCFSRKRPLNLETNNVNQIIERAQNLLSPSLPPDIELQCNLASETPLVEVDGTQLEQVLLNLLLNSSDAIDGNGQITVSTFGEEKEDKLHAVISIHDTGCGMTPATRAKIFEAFYTSKDTGTGLGLSMSLGIIQQHGGHIECDSVPSVGSEFRIYLPAKGEMISASDPSDSGFMHSLNSPGTA